MQLHVLPHRNEVDSMEIIVNQDAELIANETSSQQDVENDVVLLPRGLALSPAETYPITSRENSNFTVIIGGAGCGKTTLVTSLYQMFLKGSFGNYLFAGSQTLSAFEDRAFHTRLKSNRKNPETPRTERNSLDSILHLRLSKDGRKVNLLLSDFSGEDYNDIIANIDAVKDNFGIISSAQKLMLVIDGERLLSIRYRREEVQKVMDIFQTIYDANLLNPTSKTLIAISKYDLIKKDQNEAKIRLYINNILPQFREKFSSIANNISFCEVAAMPANENNVAMGYGLDKVLVFLTDCEREYAIISDQQDTVSQFDLYSERTKNE